MESEFGVPQRPGFGLQSESRFLWPDSEFGVLNFVTTELEIESCKK